MVQVAFWVWAVFLRSKSKLALTITATAIANTINSVVGKGSSVGIIEFWVSTAFELSCREAFTSFVSGWLSIMPSQYS